ncbi:MAG TPA: hypothetical protein VE422_19245 [Terriglobia bacterium]|nr:hypothetical protein [Terriglobia bacterium]
MNVRLHAGPGRIGYSKPIHGDAEIVPDTGGTAEEGGRVVVVGGEGRNLDLPEGPPSE